MLQNKFEPIFLSTGDRYRIRSLEGYESREICLWNLKNHIESEVLNKHMERIKKASFPCSKSKNTCIGMIVVIMKNFK